MALTRIRAEQISNIDYKQAVRTISLSNVTLSGGAPNIVDGVNLNIGDRILVVGQDTASQNGLYDVTIVGTGSNGTWVRTPDANSTGAINAGMIVMITEGNTYADTSWKLTTDDPIIIGTTGLTFLQNTGNSFSVINADGTNILANGVSGTVNFVAGTNITITGNADSDTITFDVTSGGSGNTISNGTSSVAIPDANGNVNISAGNISNLAVFGQGTLTLQGPIANPKSLTGNVVVADNVNAMLIGPLTFGPSEQMIVPDSSTVYIFGA